MALSLDVPFGEPAERLDEINRRKEINTNTATAEKRAKLDGNQ